MKNILKRGGIEFLAVFLGIALSLWVDDYRELKEMNTRLNDDYDKIFSEVKSNLSNINEIILKNQKFLDNEKKLITILDGNQAYKHKEIVNQVYNLNAPTFFGRTSAYNASVASGRFNISKNDLIIEEVSLLYEHYFTRLYLNGDLFDERMMNFKKNHAFPFFKPYYTKSDVDTMSLKKYFFSDKFHNGILLVHDFRKNFYLNRLNDTRDQLMKVNELLK